MILVDAGPLIAILKADDRHHESCTAYFAAVQEPLTTVWPVITEAAYMVQDVLGARQGLLELLEKGALELLALDVTDVPRIRELSAKYADLPMDLADAALVCVAEREGLDTVFTLDRRDFSIYRMKGGRRFKIVP